MEFLNFNLNDSIHHLFAQAIVEHHLYHRGPPSPSVCHGMKNERDKEEGEEGNAMLKRALGHTALKFQSPTSCSNSSNFSRAVPDSWFRWSTSNQLAVLLANQGTLGAMPRSDVSYCSAHTVGTLREIFTPEAARPSFTRPGIHGENEEPAIRTRSKAGRCVAWHLPSKSGLFPCLISCHLPSLCMVTVCPGPKEHDGCYRAAGPSSEVAEPTCPGFLLLWSCCCWAASCSWCSREGRWARRVPKS